MIAIDVGAAQHRDEVTSVARVIERFNPPVLYAFDPLASPYPPRVGRTRVVTVRAAVWTHDGSLQFTMDGTRSRIGARGVEVRCIGLCRFIRDQEDTDVILKIDAEGAEYALLEQLAKEGLDEWVRIAWVEWHPETHDGDRSREDALKKTLACKVEDWTF
jgi:FkbM family methyltransferase